MLAVAMRPLTLCFTASHRESSFAAALSLLGGGIFPETTLRVTLVLGRAAATLVGAVLDAPSAAGRQTRRAGPLGTVRGIRNPPLRVCRSHFVPLAFRSRG